MFSVEISIGKQKTNKTNVNIYIFNMGESC